MQKWFLITLVCLTLPLYAYSTREGIRGFNNILSAKNDGIGRLNLVFDLQGSIGGKRNEDLWMNTDLALGLGFTFTNWFSFNLFSKYMFDVLDSISAQNYVSHGMSDLEIGVKISPFFLKNSNGGFSLALLPSISIPIGTKPKEYYPDTIFGAYIGQGGRFRYFTTGKTDYGGRLLISYTTWREHPIEFNLNMGYFTHNKERDFDILSYGLGMGFIFRNFVPYIEISGNERINKDRESRLLYLTSGVKVGKTNGAYINLSFNYRIDGSVDSETKRFSSTYISTGERVTPSWSFNISFASGISFYKPSPPPSYIAGTTIDSETGKPIIATIILPDTVFWSDTTGSYFVRTKTGSSLIRASKEGYITQERSLILEADKEINVCFELEKIHNPIAEFSGKVMDRLTKTPIAAEISFPETDIESFTTDDSGEFNINLLPNTYIIRIDSDGYIPYSMPILLKEDCCVRKDFYILKQHEKITLQGINFTNGSSEIESIYFPILTKGLKLLREYPDIKVEIGGYTDSFGSAEVNLLLSRERAETVMKYFIAMEIEPSRINAVGYGENMPIASNDTEEGRAMNRRIEFCIIGD